MSRADDVRERVIYQGRVQGVGFRMTARAIAQGFLVTGWVRNQADGSVLLEVQGEPMEVRAFREAIRQRMLRHVAEEDALPCPCASDEPGFEIRPTSG